MRRGLGSLLLDLLTIGIVILMLMPIVWVFLASFKPDPEIMAGNLWPTDITLEHYRQILGRRDFLIALRNSLIVATSVAIIITLLAEPAAYSLVFGYLPHGTANVAPARAVVPLGDIADPTLGVFLANLNTAYNGVLDARPALGSDVVVSGLGVIGQIVVRLLKRAGATTSSPSTAWRRAATGPAPAAPPTSSTRAAIRSPRPSAISPAAAAPTS